MVIYSGLEQETVAWDNFTTIEDDANSSRYDFGGLTTRADNSSTESIFDAQLGLNFFHIFFDLQFVIQCPLIFSPKIDTVSEFEDT